MKTLLYDMANIYQQKALDSLDATDLAHAKRYRKAADALEAQAKEIEVLKIAHEAHQTSNLKMLAVLKQQAFDLEKRKALCDQMGDALVIVAAYLPLSKVPSAQVALAAWRAMKWD